MARLVLILGSNANDKRVQIEETEAAIAEMLGEITVCSSLYETEPWGFESDATFYNQVIVVNTGYSPAESMNICLQIEEKRGRKRSGKKYESRLIDIDILFYDDLIIELTGLTIPHPRLHLRKFVLEPLCEIIPDYIHPVLYKNIDSLLKECDDRCWVKKLGG